MDSEPANSANQHRGYVLRAHPRSNPSSQVACTCSTPSGPFHNPHPIQTQQEEGSPSLGFPGLHTVVTRQMVSGHMALIASHMHAGIYILAQTL